ncbi:MAG: ATP-binding protein [Maritimibacter sp.]
MTDAPAASKARTVAGLSVCARELSVREALKDITLRLRREQVDPDDIGVAEILIAEVLNNIVEHAYAGTQDGMITVELGIERERILIETRDCGVAMPGLNLPDAKEHDLDVEMDALPEGGFGWFLIHSLAENLTYTRSKTENLLHFTVSRRSLS